ncbi:unnamed protein product, partial [Gulo gulo]
PSKPGCSHRQFAILHSPGLSICFSLVAEFNLLLIHGLSPSHFRNARAPKTVANF